MSGAGAYLASFYGQEQRYTPVRPQLMAFPARCRLAPAASGLWECRPAPTCV